MANEFKVRKGLVVNGSGSVILDVQGSQGQLFSVTDVLSGSLFAVKDISGMPIIEAFSDDRVNIGTFNREAIKVSGSVASVTGSFTGSFTGSLFGTASQALTASYAMGGSASSILFQTASAATTWSFNHFLQTQYPVFTIYDEGNNVIVPQQITAVDTSSALIYFSSPKRGVAVASKGGYSASVVTSATTANTAITASYALLALSASNAPGFTFTFSQSVSAVTWSINHNMNTRTPLVQVYDIGYNQLIPNQIVSVTQNLTEVRFDYGQNGYAVLSSGMAPFVTGSTSLLNQTTPALTWSFAHNLNTKYVNFEVYDSTDYTMIPSAIRVIDTNNAEIHMAYPTTGRAVANFSGINGQMNAQTASLALTASFVLPLRQTVLITGSFISSGSTQAFFGNLGLGTTTPSGALHINSSNFNTATSTSIFITDHGNNTNDGNEAARIQFQSRYWSNDDMLNAVQSAIVHGKNAGNGFGGSFLSFHTTTRNTAFLIERVRISSEGVGINKTSPSASLDVSGSMLVTGSLAMSGSFTQNGFTTLTRVSQSLNYADDTAAAAGGVPLGGLYRNGNFILIRLS
jgi:hypothetical protein